MRIRNILLMLSILLAVQPVLAAEEKDSLLVQDVKTSSIEDSLSATLTEVVASEVKKLNKFSVMSSKMVEALVGLEAQKDLLGCDDVSCMAEISGALGSKYYLSSSVALMGKNYVINMELIDVESVKAIQQIYQSIEAPVELLLDVLSFNVQKLFVEMFPELESQVAQSEIDLAKRIKAAKSSTRNLQKAAIAVGAVGGAAVITGGIFTGLAFKEQKAAAAASRQTAAEAGVNRMRVNEKAAYSLLGAGGLLVVSAAIMGGVYHGRINAAKKAEAKAADDVLPAPQALVIPQIGSDNYGLSLALVW